MADPYRVSRTDPLDHARAAQVRAAALSQVVDAIWEDWNLDVVQLQRQHPEITGQAIQRALRQAEPHLDSRVRRAAAGDAKPGSNRRAISGVLANKPARQPANARPITNKERDAINALRSTRHALMLSEKTLLERTRRPEKQAKPSPLKQLKERVGAAFGKNCKERPESTPKKSHGKGGARNVSFIPWCDETSRRRH